MYSIMSTTASSLIWALSPQVPGNLVKSLTKTYANILTDAYMPEHRWVSIQYPHIVTLHKYSKNLIKT